MTNSTHLYGQLFGFLRQYSRARDLRHLKALAWMVSALIGSGHLSLSAWEPNVPSRATKAQSFERRWQRFLLNVRVRGLAKISWTGFLQITRKPLILLERIIKPVQLITARMLSVSAIYLPLVLAALQGWRLCRKNCIRANDCLELDAINPLLSLSAISK